MNTDTNRDFVWNEKTSKEWAEYFFNERVRWASLHYGKAEPVPIDLVLQQFKSQRSSQLNIEVGWEIVSFIGRYNNGHDDSTDLVVKKENERWATIKYKINDFDIDHCIKFFPIHSVRRLPDNSIWTVGDEDEKYGKIVGWKIQSEKWMLAVCENKFIGAHVFISDLKKPDKQVPQPLFVTEDGKEIYSDKDSVWWVGKKSFNMGINCLVMSIQKGPYANYWYFSTKEKAKEYVLMNKKEFSINEILYLCEQIQFHNRIHDREDEDYYAIYISLLKTRLIEIAKSKIK